MVNTAGLLQDFNFPRRIESLVVCHIVCLCRIIFRRRLLREKKAVEREVFIDITEFTKQAGNARCRPECTSEIFCLLPACLQDYGRNDSRRSQKEAEIQPSLRYVHLCQYVILMFINIGGVCWVKVWVKSIWIFNLSDPLNSIKFYWLINCFCIMFH